MTTRIDRQQTWNAAGVLVQDVPVVVDTTTEVNTDILRTRMANALTANAAYLALATPTNADVVAQVRLLTRECSGIMRMVGNWLDTTTGT